MEAQFEIYEDIFRRCVMVGGPTLDQLFTGTQFGEGPVYFADTGTFIWSDIPGNRLLRWVEGAPVSVFRSPSNNTNGNTRDRQGRLLSCEHSGRRVSRTELDGSITVIADSYQGRKLNSPNDVVVKSDNSIWFTDPNYGISNDWEGTKAPQEQKGCYVYRVDGGTGEITLVVDDCEMPNGLAFSPDEKILYVSDTGFTERADGPHGIRAYDVVDGRKVRGGRDLATIDPGCSDGFRIDTEGFIWTSAGDGVHVLSPAGALLGRIKVPEYTTNLTFGGLRRNRLFMTGPTSLWSIVVNRQGCQLG
ncbi:MAG TPA: SMP-30/gluconolactonase/LRE family protein [Dongiaceae bacterium]|jgi:gluconolactonase|nr:SMP-30/gluconolactonase/LRE family protein [Dongiaceae bacterium]